MLETPPPSRRPIRQPASKAFKSWSTAGRFRIYALVPASNQINVQMPSSLPASGTATVAVRDWLRYKCELHRRTGTGGCGNVQDPDTGIPEQWARRFKSRARPWDVMPASVATFYGLPACTGLSASTLCGQPAKAGQNIVGYWTGGGPTTPSLPAGQVAPANGSTLYQTLQTPLVTIGGIPAAVAFSGIAPGTAGEYQLNLTIPAGSAAGDRVPLVVYHRLQFGMPSPSRSSKNL